MFKGRVTPLLCKPCSLTAAFKWASWESKAKQHKTLNDTDRICWRQPNYWETETLPISLMTTMTIYFFDLIYSPCDSIVTSGLNIAQYPEVFICLYCILLRYIILSYFLGIFFSELQWILFACFEKQNRSSAIWHCL